MFVAPGMATQEIDETTDIPDPDDPDDSDDSDEVTLDLSGEEPSDDAAFEVMEGPAELLTRALSRIEASDRAFVEWASTQTDDAKILHARLCHQRQTGAGLAAAAVAMSIISRTQ